MTIKTHLEQLSALGKWIQGNNWCPATSGNLSTRLPDHDNFWISVSGKYKGELTPEDFIEVNTQGEPVSCNKRPSAETLLHALIYKHYPETTFVLHTHSVYGTVLSQVESQVEQCQDEKSQTAPANVLRFQDYELQKAFTGVDTHEGVFSLPMFKNSQNMEALAADISAYLEQGNAPHGFILAGHGLYTWGCDAEDAKRHLEALEFLFECEYKRRLLTVGRR
ncbi:MAG: methylthioribulose-1-phosphate dehydratase [Gammaproteobacteria bacterium]|nr:MAG: methylthioribulose-1-phosphate dehydratase [Gammaproteobacteria bacterium]